MRVALSFYVSSGQHVSVLMQEDNNIARCLCSLFNYLNLVTFTSKGCVFFCHLREKALDGMADRSFWATSIFNRYSFEHKKEDMFYMSILF